MKLIRRRQNNWLTDAATPRARYNKSMRLSGVQGAFAGPGLYCWVEKLSTVWQDAVKWSGSF